MPMAKGFVYLVAIMDWHSRYVLAWRLSITMETDFCVEALEDALHRFGRPDIFNTDQGAQFTAAAFTGALAARGVQIGMGRGAWLDWLPQETILFNGARLYRTFDIHVADGARLLAIDAVLLGRRAMGEHTPYVHLRDRWRVWNGDDLVFADEVRLDQSLVAGAALLNGSGAYASALYVGDDHAERASIVRNLIEAGRDHVQGGASAFGGKLFCRMLARDGFSLRKVLIPIMQALRDGEPLPRLWTI